MVLSTPQSTLRRKEDMMKNKKEEAMVKNKKKLSKFVKQNSVGRLVEAENTLKNKWQRVDLNRRPRAYESPALPLSYAAAGRI
jgi:hypothetical protein